VVPRLVHARRAAALAWARPIVAALVASVLLVGSAPAGAETIVSLSFDDGSADQMTAAQMLADHGLRGTFFVIPGTIGSTSRYMTWDDVASVYAGGNEIGGHTLTHPDLTTLPADQQRAEICGARQDLVARGYPQLSMAYPRGHYDATSEGIAQECGYLSARGSGGLGEFPAESIPPLNRWAIRTHNSVKFGDTVDTLEGWVREAQGVEGGWLNIVFHHVCDSPAPPCTEYNVSPSDLDTFLRWLRGQELLGTQVRTIGEVIAANPQPLLKVLSARSRRNGTAKLRVYVGCAGEVRVVDRKRRRRLRRASLLAHHAGVVTVGLGPTRLGRQVLTKKGKFRAAAEVTFTPFPGTSTSQAALVKVKRPAS
jgi:peptidoglycan/xylan/chitin deacetylase (PgdA/CDA1 family)